MNPLGKILSPLFKAEILALHYTHNVAMFFAVLPLLNSETSGSRRGPVLEAWKRGMEAAETGFAHFQMGQMKVLNKLGLLDAEFIGKRARDYMYLLGGRKASEEKQVDIIIGMNKSGMLPDTQAAKLLDDVGRSSNLSFGCDPATGAFFSYSDQTKEQTAAQQAVWDKMQDWAVEKSAAVGTLKGQAQKDLAMALTGVFQDIPVGKSESATIAVSARGTERNRLCLIFKDAVDGGGQPLAATEIRADALPAMKTWLETDPEYLDLKKRGYGTDIVQEREQFAVFLDAYAQKKPPGPQPA